MKIVTASNGKKTVKISKAEWQQIGKQAGWMKVANDGDLTSSTPNTFNIKEWSINCNKLLRRILDVVANGEGSRKEWLPELVYRFNQQCMKKELIPDIKEELNDVITTWINEAGIKGLKDGKIVTRNVNRENQIENLYKFNLKSYDDIFNYIWAIINNKQQY